MQSISPSTLTLPQFFAVWRRRKSFFVSRATQMPLMIQYGSLTLLTLMLALGNSYVLWQVMQPENGVQDSINAGQWLGPIILVNTDGFYNGLLKFLRHSIDECFMGSSHLKMWSVVDEPEQVLEAIENSHAWDGDALQFANVTHANA